MEFKLQWTRNPNVPYPKTWLRFKAKDLLSDNLVEYRICDLPENRFDEFFDLVENDFLVNEPGNSTLGTKTNPVGVNAFKIICEAAQKQKLISVCIKDGSDEICGFNILYVNSKTDNVDKQFLQLCADSVLSRMIDAMAVLYGDFDIFEHYNVDQFLASLALSVVKKYGQRGIGRKLLEARKLIGTAHGLKITHSTFTSVYSNKLSDQVGYKLDREMRWDELRALNPTAPFNETLTAKTWILE